MWPFSRKRASALAMTDSRSLGQMGEKLACRFLRRQGLKILARNYRCPVGEADLIALDSSTRRTLGAETIVFVEVKARTSDRYTDVDSAVDSDKQRRLRRVADYYLSSRDAAGFGVRFDIVAVLARQDEEPRVEHIVAAF